MIERVSDRTLRTLVTRGKLVKGAAPFLKPARGMIALREEGYRRGIAGAMWDTELKKILVVLEGGN